MQQRSDNASILLFGHDAAFTRLVEKHLQDAGYDVNARHDGLQAIDFILSFSPQLIILVLMMPELDGLATCKEIRKIYSGPILMLSTLNDEVNEIIGLEAGADDYISKPLRPRILLARIRSLLRRNENLPQVGETITVGNMCINSAKRTVSIIGSFLDITDSEFDLLMYLARRAGRIVTRDDLYNNILHFRYDGLDRTLDIRISRLRKKISEYDQSQILIKTVRSKGYLLFENP
jgi:two-component system, OmpR family, response regulator RstA